MAKTTSKARNSQIENNEFDVSQFEVVHSGGFSPMWKPLEKNEYVVLSPESLRRIELKQGKKVQITYLLEGRFFQSNSSEFWASKTKTEVSQDETVSIPISYGLVGKMGLGVHETDDDIDSPIIPSPLVVYCVEHQVKLMVKFLEKSKSKNGQQFKSFVVLAPKGIREKILASGNGQ